MSDFAGNLPRKFISFCHLGFESSAYKLSEERESRRPQKVAERDEGKTVVVGETSTSPAKGPFSLQGASMRAESIGAKLGVEDHDLTMAEKDCVLTSSDEDVEDLSAFVTERLQCLSKVSVEKLIGDESVNVEEILCGDVGVEDDGGDKRQCVCPNVTIGGDVDVDGRMFSPDAENNRILREELGSANVTSYPKRAACPFTAKRRNSVLKEPDEPVCKAVVFDVASGSGTVGRIESSRGNVTDPSEGVPESFVMSGVFSTLEGTARRQADGRFACTRMSDEGEGIVRIPPVDEMLGQEAAPKERTNYYPSLSAKSLLKDCFELNPPTHLDPSHPTTSFSADQMIQFARAVGMEVSLASNSMLEDLLLKARGDSGGHPVTSHYLAGKSPFPSAVGSLLGNSVASQSVYSLPTITETEGTL